MTTPIQAANVQRDVRDRRSAIMAMDRAQLGGAWWVYVHSNSGDATEKTAVALRARELKMTTRDLAREAHRGGLISDEQLAGYR